MLKVGLTGNIGSGKSTVAKVFKVLGVPVFNADNEARNLYKDGEVINLLEHTFGSHILDSKRELIKKELANIIFSDKKALATINEIIHPRVLEVFNNWCKSNADVPYIIHEAAIIFENNLQNNFDRIITVSAIEELRIERVLNRDNVKRTEILERIKNQMSDKEKCSKSDYIVFNNEGDFIIPQVLNIHKQLLSL